MQKARIIDELPGIVHEASVEDSVVQEAYGRLKQRGTFFFANSLNMLELLARKWLSVALRILMSWSISDVKYHQATEWPKAIV
jgi:hypothetical protein